MGKKKSLLEKQKLQIALIEKICSALVDNQIERKKIFTEEIVNMMSQCLDLDTDDIRLLTVGVSYKDIDRVLDEFEAKYGILNI